MRAAKLEGMPERLGGSAVGWFAPVRASRIVVLAPGAVSPSRTAGETDNLPIPYSGTHTPSSRPASPAGSADFTPDVPSTPDFVPAAPFTVHVNTPTFTTGHA